MKEMLEYFTISELEAALKFAKEHRDNGGEGPVWIQINQFSIGSKKVIRDNYYNAATGRSVDITDYDKI